MLEGLHGFLKSFDMIVDNFIYQIKELINSGVKETVSHLKWALQIAF